jgi:3-keto-L-gulonate-6-phosphate decarboxylase
MPDPGHEIATEAAQLLVSRGMRAGLTWEQLCVSMETTLAIVVVGASAIAQTPDPHRFAQEIIEAITERAHDRARAILDGEQTPEPPHG